MLRDIVEATALEGYHVRLRFDDGVVGELDLSAVLKFEGVFAPLKNLDRFRELGVHPGLGTIYSIGRTGPTLIPPSSTPGSPEYLSQPT